MFRTRRAPLGHYLGLAALLGGLVAMMPRAEATRPVPRVIDLHVDLSYQHGYKGKPFSTGLGQFFASGLSENVRGVVLPLFVPRSAKPNGRTLQELEASYERVMAGIWGTPPYSAPGCGVGAAAGEQRSVSTWLSFEGSEALALDRSQVRAWVGRGLRVFGLVHAEHNDLSESSGEPETGAGLSDRGRALAQMILEEGGLLDVSHASDQATDQLIELSREYGAPILATHSNARAVAQHPRNLRDDQLKRIAEQGGIVGVNFHSRFVNGDATSTLDEVVKQVRHMARVGGVKVLAIGSDFEGGISPPPELSNLTKYRVLYRALRRAGFSEESLELFFFGNAERVLCSGPRVSRPR